MSDKLDEYLEEIDHYLGIEKGSEGILSSIKSDILERAEKDSGAADEAAVARVIEGYGSPKAVAARYLEGHQVISPLYKKYLLRYTWLLFLFHGGLTVLAYFLDLKIQAFPIFFVPPMDTLFDLVSQLPMTLLYDLAVVGIIFYFVTQSKGDFKLAWPRIFFGERKEAGKEAPAPGEKAAFLPKKPRLIFLVLMIAGFCAVLYVYFEYGTLFFRSLNPEKIESLFDPHESMVFSLLLISLFALEILFYVIRFLKNSYWVSLAKNGAYLLVLLGLLIFPSRMSLPISASKTRILSSCPSPGWSFSSWPWIPPSSWSNY